MAIHSKSAARIMAVQALYRSDFEENLGSDAKAIIEKIKKIYKGDKDLKIAKDSDNKLLDKIIEGVVTNLAIIDEEIKTHLSKGWEMERLGPVMRSILRAGIFEIMFIKDLPKKVIISEYVKLAEEFLSSEEPKFANAILDNIAKKVRPNE